MASRNQTAYFYPLGQGSIAQVEFAATDVEDVEIRMHWVNPEDHTVDFLVEWRYTAGILKRGRWFSEYDVQTARPKLVYGYWDRRGGRCVTTKLNKYHVFGIVDECGKNYYVQWTGYDEDEATWETKAKVKRICPRAVLDWQYCKKSKLSN